MGLKTGKNAKDSKYYGLLCLLLLTGLYWALLGLTGPYLGLTRPYWAFFGPTRPYLGLTEPYLDPAASNWTSLGLIWSLLGLTGPYLVLTGTNWALLVHTWPYWALLSLIWLLLSLV